jgi:hypothetical protein
MQDRAVERADASVGHGEKPLISVIVPTRDRTSTLWTALRSILAQRVRLEVIVVDDGTDDAADRVCAAIADDRVRMIASGGCTNAAAARNLGLAQARAEWIAFCDDDDLWAPDRLEVMIAAIGDAHWACSGAVHVDADLAIIGHQRVGANDLARIDLDNVVPGGGSGVIARRSALRETGGFDAQFAHSEDWDLWTRLAGLGAPAIVDRPLVAYRIWPGSKSRNAAGLDAAAARIRSRVDGAGTEAMTGSDRTRIGQRLRSGDRCGAARKYLALARHERRIADLGRALGASVAPGVLIAAQDRRARRAVPASWRSEAEPWLANARADRWAMPGLDATSRSDGAQRRAWRRLRASADQRRRSRKQVLAAPLLAPGVYLPTGDRMWYRPGVALPAHLAATKVSTVAVPHRARIVNLAAWIWSFIVSTIMIPPWRQVRSVFGFSRVDVVLESSQGDVVLIDLGSRAVARFSPEHLFDDAVIELRHRYSAHLAAPGCWVDDDPRILIEEFVEGEFIGALPVTEQVAVAARLIAGYASLLSAEGTEDPPVRDHWTRSSPEVLKGLFDNVQLPVGLLDALGECEVHDQMVRWPLIPDNSSVRGTNIVVRDGIPVVIDWPAAKVGWEPFILSPMRFVLGWRSPGAVRLAWWNGELDDAFDALWGVAGLEAPERSRAAALWCLAETARRVIEWLPAERIADPASFSGVSDAEQFSRWVRETWSRLER